MLPLGSVLLAWLAVPAFADVHVVDPGGGPGKALLQQALDEAHSGDIILLRSGSYGPELGALLVDGKALIIVADEDVSGLTLPALVLSHVPAEEAFVVRGLDMKSSYGDFATVKLYDSDGAVWLEGVHVACWTSLGSEAARAVAVYGGHGVVVRSVLLGGKGGDSTAGALLLSKGGPGLELGEHITASVFESVVRGGDGGDGVPMYGWSTGGPGVLMPAGPALLVATDSVVQGGAEGSDTEAKPGEGGDGVLAVFPAADEVFLRGTTLSGGDASPAGEPGVPFTGLASNLVEWPAPPRSLQLPPLVRSRHAGQIQATGQPGDVVGALFALDGVLGAPLAGPQGTLLVSPASPAILLGTIDPLTGGLTVDFVLPALPADVDGERVFAQGLFLGADGFTLGSGSAMAWIASGL